MKQFDYVCLQETKIAVDDIDERLVSPLPGFESYWSCARKSTLVKRGYSGVATYCRHTPSSASEGMGLLEFDLEGRVVVVDTGPFILINTYVPNSGREHRLDYKMRFLEQLESLMRRYVLKDGRHVVLVGDLNIAHLQIDVWNGADLDRQRSAEGKGGFHPQERLWMTNMLQSGWVDCLRMFYPDMPNIYTWWDQKLGFRSINKGWRIDYCLVSAGLQPHVENCYVDSRVLGSDHAPVVLVLKDQRGFFDPDRRPPRLSGRFLKHLHMDVPKISTFFAPVAAAAAGASSSDAGLAVRPMAADHRQPLPDARPSPDVTSAGGSSGDAGAVRGSPAKRSKVQHVAAVRRGPLDSFVIRTAPPAHRGAAPSTAAAFGTQPATESRPS